MNFASVCSWFFISQNGRSDANPLLSALWGLLTATVALILLLPSADALGNLQNVTIVATSPFILIMIGLMISTLLDMRKDVIYQDYQEQQIFAARLAHERRAMRDHERRQKLAKRYTKRMAKKAESQGGTTKKLGHVPFRHPPHSPKSYLFVIDAGLSLV
ncbi:BCCT family transporter [Corynebacterium cystitidis]|uniref:BCCT family transporter n=1 Tax=Corynebacterium cystitidis TaxID=35757 RepID=UPI001E612004|nr:BCCT family transporter [Corynebacterium cystitidis]